MSGCYSVPLMFSSFLRYMKVWEDQLSRQWLLDFQLLLPTCLRWLRRSVRQVCSCNPRTRSPLLQPCKSWKETVIGSALSAGLLMLGFLSFLPWTAWPRRWPGYSRLPPLDMPRALYISLTACARGLPAENLRTFDVEIPKRRH